MRSNRTLLFGIAAVAIVTIGDSALALHSVASLHAATGQVMHSQSVLEALDRLFSTAQDAETGQRGYLLTGDPAYLTPYYSAEGLLRQRLQKVDSLTRDEPAQQPLLSLLQHGLAAKMAELQETVELRTNEGADAAKRVVTTGLGMAEMDSVRARVGAMVSQEDAQLRQRRVEAATNRTRAESALLLGGLLELATLAIVIGMLRRQMRARERAAASLHDQKERLRVTLSSIGDAVITTDLAGVITSLNPVAEVLTGWPRADAIHQPLERVFRIINDATRQAVDSPALRALREGAVVGLANHTLLLARDGSECPIDDSAAPIRDNDGQVVGAVLVFRDITERYLAEHQLREGDRRKDEFLAVLAHELRNPLAPLRNALAVMRISQNDGVVLARVGGIMERQLEQMVHLIDDLLDVSRVTRNRLELRREATDVAAVIHAALETCGPLLRESGHALKLTLPPHPLYVDADRTRLAQAVGNLLNNAIKYTEPGGRIRLSAIREGSDAVITVRDTGIGLPGGMLEPIFEMFTQVDRSLERTRGGLGIGLPLVRHIVEMHGGSVRASSPGEGHGSEFVIRLPVILTPPQSNGGEALPHRAVRPRRILVADDSADNAESLAMMLRVMGHEVRVAADGEAALREGGQFSPEVALLDIGMPGLNGYDTARAIRAVPWGHTVVLVALTGWGQDEDRRRSKEAGFDYHMVKPVDIAALEDVLAGESPAARAE